MIKIKEYKEPQHGTESIKYLEPKKLYLPLSQHTGAVSVPCVERGDEVIEASIIAKASAFISANLHAPVNGKVVNIDTWAHPNLKRGKAIIIQPTTSNHIYNRRAHTPSMENNEILEIIKESGIVGMGGAAFPTQVKLNPPKKIDILIINGCECEPYLATDYRLMIENLKEIFKGIELVCRLIKPKQVIIAIEDNKPLAIKKANSFVSVKKIALPEAKVIILKSSYPQGSEKQLIETATKRKVPPGGLPLDVGCLVHNVATCFAIYEAIYLGKPLIERLVSFCGDALVEPKNIWLKIGTTLKELFDQKILEFKHQPEKIISGGPMMGISLDSLDYPILKGTGGFLFLKDLKNIGEEAPCIRCARCIDACPMNLMPLEYTKRVKIEEYDNLDQLNIVDCIECGNCAYTCPGKIPIVHYIKIGKKYASKSK